MIRAFFAALALLLSPCAVGQTISSPPAATVEAATVTAGTSLRQIGARVGIFNQKSGSNTRAGFRSWQFNHAGGYPVVCFYNGYTNSALAGVETGTGGTFGGKIYLELNGVATPWTWGGAANPSIASNAWGCSDPSTVYVASFTKYRICGDVQMGAGGTVPSMGWSNAGDPGGGDEYQVGTSSDFCASGAALAKSAAQAIHPQLVLGQSNRSVWGLVGDSIVAGVSYTQHQISGGRGIFAALSETGPVLNYGVPGDRAAWYTTKSTIRRQLLAAGGASAIVDQLAINDFNGGAQTAAGLAADRAAIRSLFTGLSVYETTAPPTTSSTDLFKTTANQTVAGSSANRTAYNALLRGGIAGVAGVLDLAAEVETNTSTPQGTVLDGGVWLSECMVGGDGTHPIEQCERQRFAPIVRQLPWVRR